MKRQPLPSAVELEVLLKSARRCALCYGLNNDFGEKQGQIAHLNKDRSNHSLMNLVFLCLNHHDRYDGTTSQSKGYSQSEVQHYRDKLYLQIAKKIGRECVLEAEVERLHQQNDVVLEIEARFSSLEKSLPVLKQEILTRCNALFEYIRLDSEWFQAHCDAGDDECADNAARLQQTLAIPEGVWGLGSIDAPLPKSWLNEMKQLIPVWISGKASYDDCQYLTYLLDGLYDLDLHWVLFGIPNRRLSTLAHYMLEHYIYVFGMRGQSTRRSSSNK